MINRIFLGLLKKNSNFKNLGNWKFLYLYVNQLGCKLLTFKI